MNEKKGCPLLPQKETCLSLTVDGEAHTASYFLPCLEERCAAYRDGYCHHFNVEVYEDREEE